MIVGAVLRIDLRGYSGDLPRSLGAPMRDAEAPEGVRSLFYDLGPQIEGLTSGEACRRLAVRLDRLFLVPDKPVFDGALAVRLRLDLGLTVPEGAGSYAHDLPASLLDCLGQMEAELGLTYYPTADESDSVVEDA